MNDLDIIYVIFRRDTLKVIRILNDEYECIETIQELEDNDQLDWRAINLNAVLSL